jgi:hypothetical protein
LAVHFEDGSNVPLAGASGAQILSGYPHLEEAYWFGEGVLPELRRRGVWAPPGTPGADSVRELAAAGAGPR